jgi:hypothetical protein
MVKLAPSGARKKLKWRAISTLSAPLSGFTRAAVGYKIGSGTTLPISTASRSTVRLVARRPLMKETLRELEKRPGRRSDAD